MAKVTLGSIVQGPQLASEKLLQQETQAEGSTPQAYESFVRTSEKEALEYREENKEDEEEFGTDVPPGEEGTDAPVGDDNIPTDSADDNPNPVEGDVDEGDDTLSDTIEDDSGEAVATNEALDDWIRDKTQNSNSSFIRNAGDLAAGLARLGIKYGPGLLSAMMKGTLWTFSRIGTTIFAASDAITDYVEKSNNSISKLEARLKTAERFIIDQLNDGNEVPGFTYKNQKVLNYLKIGKNLDIAGNLRQFSSQLVNTTSSIAGEFEAGSVAVDRLSKSDSKTRISDFSAFMAVDVPKRGFKDGGPNGFQIKSMMNALCHTDPPWPGDASLVFSRPKNSSDMDMIQAGYKHADMYVAVGDKSAKSATQMRSLSATDLVLVAKSAKILVSACKEVTKTQEKMKKMDESLINSVKRLFYDMADDGAKDGNLDEVVNMVYLRTHLSSKVFVKGAASCQTHASRVLAASVQLLEDHAKRLAAKVS